MRGIRSFARSVGHYKAYCRRKVGCRSVLNVIYNADRDENRVASAKNSCKVGGALLKIVLVSQNLAFLLKTECCAVVFAIPF